MANRLAVRVLVVALVLMPILWAFEIMRTHWVAVPWWDEWLTPGKTLASYYQGGLHFVDLWSQHNESRKFFPRLLYLALYLPFGWDVRLGMAVTFAWVCVGSVALFFLLRQGLPVRIAYSGFILMNLLLFSPREYENFLYSIEGENFTPAFALVFAMLCNLRAKSFQTKAIINGVLAFLSTYTCANGMLIWLLAFPMNSSPLASDDVAKSRSWRICYSLAAIISIGLYFVGYKHPPDTPPFASRIATAPRVLHYFVTWIGNLFITPIPGVVGLCVLLLFVVLTIIAIRQIRVGHPWQMFYPWFLLGVYTLISGLVTASGRVGFGTDVALDVRYTAFTVFFYITLIGLICSIYHGLGQAYRRSFAVAGLALLIMAWTFTYWKEMPRLKTTTDERKHLQLVMRWSLVIPANPDLKLLSPYRETLDRIQIISEHRALRPKFVDPEWAQKLKEPLRPSIQTAGYLDEVKFASPDRLLADGWAQIPSRGVPADSVILGYGDRPEQWTPFGVIETGRERPDVAAAFHKSHLNFAGFGRTFITSQLSDQLVTFEARAVDMKQKRLFPLSGTFTVVKPTH